MYVTRSTGKALPLVASLMLLAGSAASVPDPRYSSCDAVGVGNSSGRSPGGSSLGFRIVLRDVSANPIATGWAGLSFSGSGVRVYSAQNSGVTVDVVNQAVSERFTTGAAYFALRTGGYTNTSTVEAIGDGVDVGLARWRSTDIDALDGKTGLGDLAYFSSRFLGRVPAPECNFDRSASDVPDLVDLEIFTAEYLSGASGSYAW
jgi:hypothetical protein